MLAGNALNNTIRSGNGGASIWGGTDGDDHLYGGEGADTFIAGQGEGNTTIRNYAEDDVIRLPNINLSDLKYLAYSDSYDYTAYIRTNDDTDIESTV